MTPSLSLNREFNRMLRIIFSSLVLVLLASCTTHQKPPLPQTPIVAIEGQKVTSIQVRALIFSDEDHPRDKVICTIRNAGDIQFVVAQLQGLKVERYSGIHPKFDIVLKTKTGQSVRLRISKRGVGPDGPAHIHSMNWFPVPRISGGDDHEFELYTFLKKRAFGDREPE